MAARNEIISEIRKSRHCMSRVFFRDIETFLDGYKLALEDVVLNLQFNDQGLIPVIVQDVHSQQVLMQAWMNRPSLQLTMEKGYMVYWSRSRQCIWEKGATSGHVQKLMHMAIDCDGDVLLCQVQQTGPACHTGRPSCFYLDVDIEQQHVRINGNAPTL